MCEIKVALIDSDGACHEFKNVMNMEFVEKNIIINFLFENHQIISKAVIDRIDCMSHHIYLKQLT